MNTPLLLVSCLALLASLDAPAQAPKEAIPAKPREIEDMFALIPKGDLMKLRGSKQAETIKEINAKIGAAELQKEGTFRITVDSVEPKVFEEGLKGWAVRGKQKLLKAGGATIIVTSWIYVRVDPDKLLAKIRSGRDLVVTGRVAKAELALLQGDNYFTADIHTTTISEGK